jgi:multidrug efflux pump subunit AcrB
MRNLVAYFIRYQVAVNIFVLAFVLFGIYGASALKSSFFPLTESKIVQISINYPGASPLEIEEGVVLQIEDNLKGLQGVDRVTAVANENSGRITVEIEKPESAPQWHENSRRLRAWLDLSHRPERFHRAWCNRYLAGRFT